MKDSLNKIKRYIPWLLLLLGVDLFSSLLLWIADIPSFRAMSSVILLSSVLLFAAVCAVLLFLERHREKAFLSFLDTPDEYHEELLVKAMGTSQSEAIHLLALTLREKQNAYDMLETRLADYEEYVESWAHETKTPLSLLTLLLDNRREILPEADLFKLDYIRNRIQEFTDQMLYYSRIKGTRKDYRLEHISILSSIEEVLEDYRPLLEEKQFQIILPSSDSYVYTDQRGLRFLLAQLVSNSIKYSRGNPELTFSFFQEEKNSLLSVRDNGIGVRSCDLPFLFEKNFTGDSGEEKKKATGMGLYLAKEIAKDLGLSLEASSEWGQGFEMRIYFPIVNRQQGTPCHLPGNTI